MTGMLFFYGTKKGINHETLVSWSDSEIARSVVNVTEIFRWNKKQNVQRGENDIS